MGVTWIGATAEESTPLFALDFESKPSDSEADAKIVVALEPTEIVLHSLVRLSNSLYVPSLSI
jgi:hypothetical protein